MNGALIVLVATLVACGPRYEAGSAEVGADAGAARSRARVAERVGLDVSMPAATVTEWPRLADGTFADEQSPAFPLARVLRPGWVKVVVLEWWWCRPCKDLIRELAIRGPRQADLVVIGVRNREDHEHEDRRTRAALERGTGWLVILRSGDERSGDDVAQAMMDRIDRAVKAAPPTILILDRNNHVRAISMIGEGVTLDDTLAWVTDHVRAAYRGDQQPKASLPRWPESDEVAAAPPACVPTTAGPPRRRRPRDAVEEVMAAPGEPALAASPSTRAGDRSLLDRAMERLEPVGPRAVHEICMVGLDTSELVQRLGPDGRSLFGRLCGDPVDAAIDGEGLPF